MEYKIIAFYHIAEIEDPQNEVKLHKSFFKDKDITCRIYINENGINGQMSGSNSDADAYMEWIKLRYSSIQFKIDPYHENVFPRQQVKYRKSLVATDETINFENRADHISPEKWKEVMDAKDPYVMLDIRNDYEWEVGRFDGAEYPPCKNFREFSDYADKLKENTDPETPVLMYCTGGIRCEFFSPMLKERGFKNVYQLDGGVINYGHKVGSKNWLGKLFVFDDRMTAPISDEDTPVISTCHNCGKADDIFYNCANMTCNKLFISCSDCLEKHVGCCSEKCTEADHVRPLNHQAPHKPFRKWYKYFAKK